MPWPSQQHVPLATVDKAISAGESDTENQVAAGAPPCNQQVVSYANTLRRPVILFVAVCCLVGLGVGAHKMMVPQGPAGTGEEQVDMNEGGDFEEAFSLSSMFGSSTKPSAKPSTASGVKWSVGRSGETCLVTCNKLKLTCNERALSGVSSSTEIKKVATSARSSCKKVSSTSSSSAPDMTQSMFSGNTCYYKHTTTSCSAAASKGHVRMCPCSKASVTSNVPSGSSPGYVPPPPTTSSAFTWILGAAGQSCTDVCKSKRATCSQRGFGQLRTTMELYTQSAKMGAACAGTWVNDGVHGSAFNNVPAECTASKCGIDPHGLCAFPKAGVSPTCSGSPPQGWARFCPCSGGSSSQSSYSSLSHASTPASSNAAASTTCKAKTGVSCYFTNCYPSLGSANAVECKSRTCVCKPGYCATGTKNVCTKKVF